MALLVSHAFTAHVPLNLDGLVRPPARSISLVPANDVPARIALAGKLLVMRPSRPRWGPPQKANLKLIKHV
eukprot:scaffold111399_cov69-Phaeocystis_antarctica.AAC.1